ncbi:MAG: hypothetical protein ACK4NC_03420 [Candidatus Gracilibacteria bacterium]
MKYTTHIIRIFFLLWCFLLVPGVSYAKEALCVTPKVTRTYLIEMEAYNAAVRDLLQQKGCIIPKITVFGLDLTSISAKEDQLSKAFLEKYGDPTINTIRTALNGSNTKTSALLLQDVELAEKQLEEMRGLMNKSMDACMSINVTDVMQGEKIQTLPLYQDIQARYLAYRQLYLWMMQSDQTTAYYPNGLDGTLSAVTNAVLARYTTATKNQNPFSYIKDYKDASLTSCQSQEYGLDDINYSLDNLTQAVSSISETAEEFGDAVMSLSTIKFDLNELLGQIKVRGPDGSTIITGQGIQKGEERTFARNVLEGVIGIPLTEFTEAARKLAGFNDTLRLNGAPVNNFTFTQLQDQIVQIDATTGKITRKSLTDIPVTYSQQVYTVDRQKEEALEQYMAKNYDTLGKYETTQYFLGKMDQMTDTLSRINNTSASSADDFTFVCLTHLHRINDDCGELKK